jgi:hypothetical protein
VEVVYVGNIYTEARFVKLWLLRNIADYSGLACAAGGQSRHAGRSDLPLCLIHSLGVCTGPLSLIGPRVPPTIDGPLTRPLKEPRCMRKLKPLPGLLITAIVLAACAAPALAVFTSESSNGQGAARLKPGTNAVFTADKKALIATCEELTKGEYHVRIGTKQEATKVSTHVDATGQLTKCTFAFGGIKEPATANASCELRSTEITSGELRGSVVTECLLTSSNCTLSIPAGAPNTELTKVTATDIETKNLELVSTITGVTYKLVGCSGLPSGKDGTAEGIGIAQGLKFP